MLNDVRIELYGDRRIFIDGCKGLLEYRENIIRVALSKQTLTVTGSELALENMTEDTVTLNGKIENVSFE